MVPSIKTGEVVTRFASVESVTGWCADARLEVKRSDASTVAKKSTTKADGEEVEREFLISALAEDRDSIVCDRDESSVDIE